MQTLGHQFFGAPDVVDVIGIAAVDDDIAGFHARRKLGQRAIHRGGRHHHPDRARRLQWLSGNRRATPLRWRLHPPVSPRWRRSDPTPRIGGRRASGGAPCWRPSVPDRSSQAAFAFLLPSNSLAYRGRLPALGYWLKPALTQELVNFQRLAFGPMICVGCTAGLPSSGLLPTETVMSPGVIPSSSAVVFEVHGIPSEERARFRALIAFRTGMFESIPKSTEKCWWSSMTTLGQPHG